MPHTVLIVSATAPLPVDCGKRAVLSGLLEYFVERIGPHNVHYAMPVTPLNPPREFPGVLHVLSKPSSADQFAALGRLFTERAYTLQEAAFNSKHLRRQIHRLIDYLRPTVEIYDTARLAQHAPARSSAQQRVLYMDDLFSERYERMLHLATKTELTIDPLGQFVDFLPRRASSFARRPHVYRPALRFERDRLRRRESQIVHDFDLNLLISTEEVELLRQRSGSPGIESVKPLLPMPTRAKRAPGACLELIFIGRLNLAHNDDAICNFLRNVLEPLTEQFPGVTLRIIGKDPSRPLMELAARYSANVVLDGFVDDLDTVFAQATAMIAPLRFGSGVKIKMLEALARGVPTVATSVAAEGIPLATAGENGCLIEDDFGKWPQLLADLLDHRYNHTLSANATRFYARTYGRDVIIRQYDAIFGLHALHDQATPALHS